MYAQVTTRAWWCPLPGHGQHLCVAVEVFRSCLEPRYPTQQILNSNVVWSSDWFVRERTIND